MCVTIFEKQSREFKFRLFDHSVVRFYANLIFLNSLAFDFESCFQANTIRITGSGHHDFKIIFYWPVVRDFWKSIFPLWRQLTRVFSTST